MSKIGQHNIELEEALVEAESEVNVALSASKKEDKKSSEEKPQYKYDEEKTDWDIFKDYVESAGLAVKRSDGTTYLKAEAWLYLAMLKGLVPSVETTELPTEETGESFVVKATCKLRDKKTGCIVSQSDMCASDGEDFLTDKDIYAVYGMAETRAITRAVRNVYGYIVRGVGYESTPAIEMGLEEDGKD